MKILKFGGTSVGNPDRIKAVVEIVLREKQQCPIVVVVSAFTGVTDQLIALANKAALYDSSYTEEFKALETRHLTAVEQLVAEPNRSNIIPHITSTLSELRDILHGICLVREATLRSMDFVMSFGERLSAFIVAEALRSRKVDTQFLDAEFLDARRLIRTDSNFSNARVNMEQSTQAIRDHFSKHKALQIVTGFLGQTEKGETTTLGRGGSDLTASVFGAALSAKEIQIWTDVDGVMTADPRTVKKAFCLPHISYEEVMELSHFGAKVIYPPTVQPALDAEIPILVKNTFRPEVPGTVVSKNKPQIEFPVTGISSIPEVSLIQVQGSGLIGVAGIASRLFGALARKKVSVILISQGSSEHSICFAIDPKFEADAVSALEEEFALELESRRVDPIVAERGLSVLAIVGENMRRAPGIAGRVFQALGKNGINVVAIAQGSSELNISVAIHSADQAKALNALHDTFFLSNTKSINLFLVGAGQIGQTFLSQVQEHRDELKSTKQLELKISGLADSKKMIFDAEGLDLNRWKEVLSGSPAKMDHRGFVTKMQELNLPNSIFVDCTANRDVSALYESILAAAISVVIPNKLSNSGRLETYRRLKSVAKKANVQFFYETTVGAGLPVLNTLGDLLASGDSVVKVEAVLSGTISYLFNSFDGKRPFSELVQEAKASGFTEPDPRDDLSGKDVARKLLIISREMGLELEEQDIEVQSLVPNSLTSLPSADAFMAALPNTDGEFEQQRDQAAKAGKVLRYIASIQDGAARVGLEAVDATHPFHSLSGSDNIISFTTKRYFERPLVIKGPGAGTHVTAAGIFADVLRAASYLG